MDTQWELPRLLVVIRCIRVHDERRRKPAKHPGCRYSWRRIGADAPLTSGSGCVVERRVLAIRLPPMNGTTAAEQRVKRLLDHCAPASYTQVHA